MHRSLIHESAAKERKHYTMNIFRDLLQIANIFIHKQNHMRITTYFLKVQYKLRMNSHLS
jgi:hypothetical protein